MSKRNKKMKLPEDFNLDHTFLESLDSLSLYSESMNRYIKSFNPPLFDIYPELSSSPVVEPDRHKKRRRRIRREQHNRDKRYEDYDNKRRKRRHSYEIHRHKTPSESLFFQSSEPDSYYAHSRQRRMGRLKRGRCPVHGDAMVLLYRKDGSGIVQSSPMFWEDIDELREKHPDFVYHPRGHNGVVVTCPKDDCCIKAVAFVPSDPKRKHHKIADMLNVCDPTVLNPQDVKHTLSGYKQSGQSKKHSNHKHEIIEYIQRRKIIKAIRRRRSNTLAFDLLYSSQWVIDKTFDYKFEKPQYSISNSHKIRKVIDKRKNSLRRYRESSHKYPSKSHEFSNSDFEQKQKFNKGLPVLHQPENLWYVAIYAPVHLHDRLVDLSYLALGRQISSVFRYIDEPDKYIKMFYILDSREALVIPDIYEGLSDDAYVALMDYYTRPPHVGYSDPESVNDDAKQSLVSYEVSLRRPSNSMEITIDELVDTYRMRPEDVQEYVRITNIEFVLMQLAIRHTRLFIDEYVKSIYPPVSFYSHIQTLEA